MGKVYRSFEAYLQDNYYNEFYNALNRYIIRKGDALDFKSYTVLDPSKFKLSDFKICSVSFRNMEDHYVFFSTSILADIILKGFGRKDYEADTTGKWFTVSCCARLLEGLREFQILDVDEYSKPQFDREKTLTRYLVPYLYTEDLDKEAEKFLMKYNPEALETAMPVDIREVVGNMCLHMYLAPLPDHVFGMSYFSSADVTVYKEPFGNTEVVHIEPGSVLIDPDDWFMGAFGEYDNYDNTVIHECVHHDRHGLFFEMQKLLRGYDYSEDSLCCRTTVENPKNDPLSEAVRWIEWQACALTPRIQMPKKTAAGKFQEIYARKQQELAGNRVAIIMQDAVDEFATFFHVTRTCAKIRLSQLGYPQAMGTFNFTDGEYEEPYYFSPEALKKGETFSLNERDYHFLYTMNPDFRSLITEELFVYADGFACIKDEKYVFLNEYGSYSLTEYARDHVDECCLVFQAKTIYKAKEYDDSFFTECYLCREVDASLVVEEYFDLGQEDNQSKADFARECRKIKKQAEEIGKSADEVPTGFVGTLKYHMDRKHMSIEDVSAYSDLSTVAVRNYLNGKVKSPGKTSVLALCKALNLNFMYSADLCKKAGHDLSQLSEENSLYMDLIVNHPMETIEQWNQKLEQWGMRTIPAKNG